VIDAPVAPEVDVEATAPAAAAGADLREAPAEYAATEVVLEAAPVVAQAPEMAAAPVEEAKAKPAARRSKKKSGPQYKQMSFFDL
jgi:hypothetical protein